MDTDFLFGGFRRTKKKVALRLSVFMQIQPQTSREIVQKPRLTLTILKETIGICRFDAGAPVPDWVYRSSFYSVTRTPDELSIACIEDCIPEDNYCDKGWKCLRVEGPLDLTATGILSSLARPLAHAGVSIFALSTYDTDYLLVRKWDLPVAIKTLAEEGHNVNNKD